MGNKILKNKIIISLLILIILTLFFFIFKYSNDNIFDAINDDNYNKIKYYIKNGGNLNIKNNDGFSLLIVAIQKNKKAIVKILLEEEIDIEDADTKIGLTPLMYALAKGDKEISSLLLAKKANINATDKYGKTVFYYTLIRHPEMFDFLFSNGANINSRDGLGFSILSNAVSSGELILAKRLLAKNASIDAKSLNGGTPLISAVIFGETKCVELLCKKNADVNIIRNDGKTALDFAIEEKNLEIINLLKQYGAKTAKELKSNKNIK